MKNNTWNIEWYRDPCCRPFSFVNVTGLAFTGNTLATDAGCAASQVNYGSPVYSVGTSNAVIQTFAPVYSL